MHLRLLVLLALLVLGEPVAEPRLQPTRERTANKPVVSLPKPLISPLVSLLLVNRELHGRDQRHHWVRTVAALHPAWRVAAGALLVAWLAAHTGWGDNTCTALRVTGVVACAAILQYGVAIAIATSVLTLLVLTYIHDERAEARDYGLTELDLAAAASSAAYAPVGQRISEMRERGIESTNWIEDKSLSTEVVAVLYNRHTQTCIIAFRGTITLGDWSSNLKTILPGREENSRTFRIALETARAAQCRYAFVRRIRLTGHSRGGTMADFCGRRLGLPSIQINPGMGVKVFQKENNHIPAVSSVTARSADVVSIMEMVHAMDRKVVFRWPSRSLRALAFQLFLFLVSAAMAVLAKSGWLKTAGAVGILAALSAYIVWMHSVLRFTKK